MKKLLLSALLLAAVATTRADSYSYLVFGTTDGSTAYLQATGTKIVFENGQMVAVSGSDSVTLTLTDLAYMAFTNDYTDTDGIAAVTADDGDSPSQWFTLDGRAVAHDAGLMPGIYLVKSNGKTIKAIVR